MRKLAALALLAVLGGAYYLIHDVGHVPIFDAGLQRLAESGVEGYCAGQVFWQTRGYGDAELAEDCREERAPDAPKRGEGPAESSIFDVQPAFCRAVEDAGYAGPPCLDILEGSKLWPTYTGGLTDNWSDTAPYPLDVAFVIPPSDSRTGTRDGFSRGDEATTTTTGETTTTTEGDAE